MCSLSVSCRFTTSPLTVLHCEINLHLQKITHKSTSLKNHFLLVLQLIVFFKYLILHVVTVNILLLLLLLLLTFSAPKAPADMFLDPEIWDNKTITSGLKNYLRSECPLYCIHADIIHCVSNVFWVITCSVL